MATSFPAEKPATPVVKPPVVTKNPDGKNPVVRNPDGSVFDPNAKKLGTEIVKVSSDKSMQRLFDAYQELQGAMLSKPEGLVEAEVASVDGITATLVSLAATIRKQVVPVVAAQPVNPVIK